MPTPPAAIPFSAAAARGRLRWYSPAVVIAAAAAAMIAGSAPLLLVAHGSEAVRQRGVDVAAFTPEVAGVAPWAFLLWTLLPFALALVALLLAVRYVERRGWRSLLVGGDRRPRWTRLAGAVGLWTALAIASDLLLAAAGLVTFSWAGEWRRLLPVVAVALLLVPVQVAFEELSVRGYLHQVLSWSTGQPLVGVLVSSVVFGALHFGNPEVARFGLGAMASYYVAVGLFLAIVTVLDDGLELALGVHLATNLYGVLVVGFEGSALDMPAAWSADAPEPPLLLGLFALRATVFALVFAKAGHWDPKRLHARVGSPTHSLTPDA